MRNLAPLAFLALAALPPTDAAAAPPQRPNVLFLFTDDQRADTIAALGNPHIQTPNLDRLAQSGLVFTNAYCMGGNSPAVCRPSRNMLLSGRAYFRFDRYAERDKPNFPNSMNQAGYVTYHHGKRGNTALEIHKDFDWSKYLDDQVVRNSGYPGKVIVDEAIDFLQSRDGEKPFFLYLAFSTPHDPRVAAPQYLQRYERNAIPLPLNYLPIHPFDNGEMTVRDERLAPWPRTTDEIRKHLHDYYAVITALDEQIGRLLETLRDLGEYENTIIIFSSDHGLAIGSHGLMGKQNLYEDGMKVPLIFAGPGIPQGRSDAFAYLLDIYPTVCDLVGTEIPDGLDGQSLAPVIRGETDGVRDSVFTAYRDVQRAVRDDRWKLIRYPHINHTQLFDLASDPHEARDVAAEPLHAERIDRMMSLMRRWQRDLGDTAPLTSSEPRDANFIPPDDGPTE